MIKSQTTQGREVTYLPEIRCTTEPGLLESEATVAVEDETGARQFLSVHRDFVNYDNGNAYLPIGIVRVDRAGKRVLVELPREADSGANRLWAPLASFRKE